MATIGAIFLADFLIPFSFLLCLYGLLDKLLSRGKKKFTDIFTNYPLVLNIATYTVLALVFGWNIILALLVSYFVYGIAMMFLFIAKVVKEAWKEAEEEVKKNHKDDDDDE